MKQFYVGNSKISGRGLIAGEDILKGQIITRFKGLAMVSWFVYTTAY